MRSWEPDDLVAVLLAALAVAVALWLLYEIPHNLPGK